jgi:hypothetical protein
MLENQPPHNGVCFAALEMILFITNKLVDNKYDTIKFEIEHANEGQNNVVQFALNKARDKDNYHLHTFWLDPNYKTNSY